MNFSIRSSSNELCNRRPTVYANCEQVARFTTSSLQILSGRVCIPTLPLHTRSFTLHFELPFSLNMDGFYRINKFPTQFIRLGEFLPSADPQYPIPNAHTRQQIRMEASSQIRRSARLEVILEETIRSFSLYIVVSARCSQET